ncbi:L-lactate dehydrogenase [Floccifex sp.]|uniref:L-lactate dehydrogenase n=1 Tax=Floccifex sp. TaxID=2815810 RepID=UPI003F0D9F42
MRKVTIVGAGAVGSTAAFALSESGLVDEIVIVDINDDRAWGNAWDIAHGVPLIQPVKVRNGSYADSKDSDVVVITVGVPEVTGESRLVPLRKNAAILNSIVPQIVENSPNGKILVVSNPVDILTYLTYKISKLPKNQVFGLGTVLDSSRFRCMLSNDFGIDGRSVHGFMLGEHGDSQVAAWSLTNIAGVSVEEYAEVVGKELPEGYHDLVENNVKQSAFDVWEKKGPNCYCVADAIKSVVCAILRNEHAILPVSSFLEGEYGLDNVCLSVPAIVAESGVVRTLEVEIAQDEKEKLLKSGNMLKSLIAELEAE